MKKFIVFIMVFPFFFFSCVKKENLTSYTVELSPNMINSFLEKEFPVEEKLTIGKLILRDPQADIQKDKIYLGTTVALDLPLIQEISGRAYISGSLYFDRESKALYLKNPSIEKLIFNDKDFLRYIPPSSKDILFDSIKKIISSIPIYRFENNSLSEKLIKDIKVQNGKLLVTFGL
ncbi:MAG: DUF1439 domain-containing protein [Aquificae bacterium]|nr:DUF1439 domain-containing protein [Aquificota bacterium]